ncbi:hypothetical protein DES34_10260 [Brevibacillus brevis]|nr:hypothetical protein DES34_10260 [Brevibacillus brevis]TQK53249.1 hypothetical protein FB479_11166 [Brevibacillus sp. AG162]VEF92535.1 Uncharacterised protein [Brevibacillus brevis]
MFAYVTKHETKPCSDKIQLHRCAFYAIALCKSEPTPFPIGC